MCDFFLYVIEIILHLNFYIKPKSIYICSRFSLRAVQMLCMVFTAQ